MLFEHFALVLYVGQEDFTERGQSSEHPLILSKGAYAHGLYVGVH